MLTRVLRCHFFVIIFLCIALVGCTSPAREYSKINAPNTLTLAGKTFTIEIADDDAEREMGLRNRTTLAPDSGMLFIFERPQRVAFWMKNTLMPLDILYFDGERRLTQIFPDAPPCERDPCAVYPSDHDDIRYVLELGSGEAHTIGTKIGDEFVRDMK